VRTDLVFPTQNPETTVAVPQDDSRSIEKLDARLKMETSPSSEGSLLLYLF
jgi:hypothetical protein